MVRIVSVIALAALQVVWLFPASGVLGWLSRHAPLDPTAVCGSYGVYFLLWACWAALAWRIYTLPAEEKLSHSLRRILVAFPFLLLWDALFSAHPSYPVEWANGLLASWFSAAVTALAARTMPVAVANGCILAALSLEALFALRWWGTQARVAGDFGSPNLFYPLMLYGMLYSSAHTIYDTQAQRMIWAALGCLFAIALGAAGNRIGMIAGGLAVAWMVFQGVAGNGHRRVVGWQLVMLFIALLLPLAIGWSLRQAQTRVPVLEDRSVLGRPLLWIAGFRVAWHSHLLGCGVANYLNAQEQLNDLRLTVQGSGNMEPKNLLVAMLAIYGTPGLLYALLLFSNALRFYWAQTDETRRVGLFFLLALLVVGIADTPILIAERLPGTFLILQRLMIDARISLSSSDDPALFPDRASAPKTCVAISMTILLVVGLVMGYSYLQAQSYRDKLRALRSHHTLPASSYPSTLVELLIEREDKLFWSHSGVDWRGLHRAIRVNLRTLRPAQGGSTITQQMVRSLLFEPDFAKRKSITRKATEFWLALWAERDLGKQKVLELYLQNAFRLALPEYASVEQMARYYFGKSPIGLTLEEQALLIGWLSKPPVGGVDWYRSLLIRNVVLSAAGDEAIRAYLRPLNIGANCPGGR